VPQYNVTCPHCSAALVSPVGGNIKCPTCGGSINVTPPPDDELAKRNQWLNEVATALAPLGLTERERDTSGGATLKCLGAGDRLCVWVVLWDDDNAAEIGEMRWRQYVQKTHPRYMSNGRVAVRTVDRVVYFAEEKRKHAVDLLDNAVQAVSPIRQPTAPAADVRESSSRSTPSDTSTSGEIERLAQLHAQASLSDVEFAAAKGKLLGMPTGGDA
jgi:hypothetical protein